MNTKTHAEKYYLIFDNFFLIKTQEGFDSRKEI